MRALIDHRILHPITNLLLKAQASDGVVSSDMELDTLTAKQIYAEVSERVWRVTTRLNLVTAAADPGSHRPRAGNQHNRQEKRRH